jgi:8-oxo-dGTP pyrophosphatase MutT (NUDIX family)
MERIDSKTVYEGPVAGVRIDTVRHADGETVERQVVTHPGAVTMIPHDGECVWLVRQPREPVGEADLLELPAGKLDVDGESPLDCARRELAEEISKEAGEWRELKRFYVSPGLTEEVMYLFLATDLADVDQEPDPHERIAIVPWPLSDLDGAIDACEDSKSLVGLLMLRDLLR